MLADTLPKLELNNSNLKQFAKYIKKNNFKITLEIGFGSGENLYSLLVNNRNDYFIGCEPYLNGLAAFIAKIDEDLYNRIKLFRYDVRILLSMLPENFLDNIFILFPDPWPKSRHQKRRIINNNNIDLLINSLKVNGIIYTATDVQGYFHTMIKTFENCKKTIIVNKNSYRDRPDKIISTRYEKKAKEKKRTTFYLIAKKTRLKDKNNLI